jgi:ribonuclease J
LIASIARGDGELLYDSLSVIPLGGQSELGRMLWVLAFQGQILLLDSGASYPSQDLPGVDLLLPSTNFLEINREKVQALLLTNGHEEHLGALPYLLRHLDMPRILAPRFVSAFLTQSDEITHELHGQRAAAIETIENGRVYEIGPFNVEWIRVNDAIADACALRVGTPEGNVVYTSSFKFDQTPVDKRLIDVGRLAQIGEEGVSLLISASAGVESEGYTASERSVGIALENEIKKAGGRVFVVMPGTNTHRLQILFNIARSVNRKVLLMGEVLIRSAVAAAITGNLEYDRQTEAQLSDLATLQDNKILVVATGVEGDPMNMIAELSAGTHKEVKTRPGDVVIFSADVVPGRLRQMANILDLFLAQGVRTVYGDKQRVHVPKHASREELKLMLSLINPSYFVPTFGEGRHIMHHAQLARDWGLPPESIFALQNGDILSIHHGLASVTGAVESQAVFVNRDQGERVTTFSVNERRVLSMEGVVTVSLLVNEEGEILSGPAIDAGASGFLSSAEWKETKNELRDNLFLAHKKFQQSRTTDDGTIFDPSQLRSNLRETALKTLRARLKAKPTVQVIVQQIATTRPDRQ